MKLLKKLKIRPSEAVLTLSIVLILAISAIFSIGLFQVEYMILNMATIVWVFAQLDTTREDDFFHYWVFLTFVMWFLIVIGLFVYSAVKASEFLQALGNRIDEKYER